jgi:hypothetical protein
MSKTTESGEFAIGKPSSPLVRVRRRGGLRADHEVTQELGSLHKVGHDYYVFEDGPQIIGVVSEVTTEPRFGRDAPTLYLRRISGDPPVAAPKERAS